MEFSAKTTLPEKQRSDCIVLGIFENQKMSSAAESVDTLCEGYLKNILRTGDMEGKLGQILLLHHVPNVTAERVLLIGCGSERELADKAFRDIIRKMISRILQTGAIEAACYLVELPVKNRDVHWKVRQIVQMTIEAFYRFDQFKSQKEKVRQNLKRMALGIPSKKEIREAERAITEGQAIANGIAFAKDLGNLPPNICTPSYLAKEAEKLAKSFPSLSAAILDEKQIAALKMGALLSVGQGSKNPPRLITLEYRGRKDKQKPIVLVGKGITFDTGGNSLKPPIAMIGMKYDMCGGAAVLATLRAAAELELPLNIIGVIASAENMPGNSATRPEDIITSMSGLTIEILNTDAEGRLVLCDALTYSERFDPEIVIDVATLTSAIILALGSQASGLFSNYPPLAKELFNAGMTSGDRCWEMPLWDEYQESLNSNFADVANVANPPEVGSVLAACFLSRFTKKFKWAHLDIAGVATRSSGKERGATGRPVALLVQYLLDYLPAAS